MSKLTPNVNTWAFTDICNVYMFCLFAWHLPVKITLGETCNILIYIRMIMMT